MSLIWTNEDSEGGTQQSEDVYYSNESTPSTSTQSEIPTDSADEVLIWAVQDRPPLWDYRIPVILRGKTQKDNLWLEVSSLLGDTPPKEIIKRWKNIRDAYMNSKRSATKLKKSGSGAVVPPKKYIYHDLLRFLDDTLKTRKTTSTLNIDTTVEEDEVAESELLSPGSSVSQTRRAKKKSDIVDEALLEIIKSIPEPKSAVDPLNEAIVSLINKISPEQRLGVQMEVLNLLHQRILDKLIFGIDVCTCSLNTSVKQKVEIMNDANEDQFGSEVTEDTLMEDWQSYRSLESIDSNVDFADVSISMDTEGETVDLANVSISTDTEAGNVFEFFWWDAYEDPSMRPGVVWLFGKTFREWNKTFVSCCVIVNNIERNLYLLPRATNLKTGKPVTMTDVYHDFIDKISSLETDLDIDSLEYRTVTKNYAFDPSVPAESDYLEIKYKAKNPKLDASLSGDTFSRIFGTNSTFLEIFLLERNIRGPCWLHVSNYKFSAYKQSVALCKVEVECAKPSDISVMPMTIPKPPPPLCVAAINIKTAPSGDVLRGNEIVMISCVIDYLYAVDKETPAEPAPSEEHFCIFIEPFNSIIPSDLDTSLKQCTATKVQKMTSENSILSYFVPLICKTDADLIVGHDLTDQIKTLCDRLQRLNIQYYRTLSRTLHLNYSKENMEKILFTGRLLCDLKISAKELIKSRSYDLDALCKNVLKLPDGKRTDIEPESVAKMFTKSSDILKMIDLTTQDAQYVLNIMYKLNVIPLALQITNIAGNLMSRTLLGGRSERNEFLLLHAFYAKNHIAPEKRLKKQSTSKKPDFAGGLVLEPKIGFYDKFILSMDFNSLYPSIIQEYNICFTTIAAAGGANGTFNDEDVLLPDCNLPLGILPTEIRKLVEARREVQKLMISPGISNELRMQYHIRQIALKMTANSMYGCLGFKQSRFYAKHLAALVAFKGREILTNARELAEKLNYNVIYGDTDSLMIETNSLDFEHVFKIGNTLKQNVNKMYKQVQLEMDGIFKYLLVLKKKKYAAVTVTKNLSGDFIETQEYKGLDVVRRDFAQIACDAGRFALDQILSAQTPDERFANIRNQLRKIKDAIESNKVPLSLYVIRKELGKDPEMYEDKNSQPHVQVALRHNKKGGKQYRAGDTVPYVICKDGTTKRATQRAYLIEELDKNDEFTLDTKYYLEQQLQPVVLRICEPLEGADSKQIATSLGLDASLLKTNAVESVVEDKQFEFMRKKEIKFRNVERFSFTCAVCKTVNEVSPDKEYNLGKCRNRICIARPLDYLFKIKNKIVARMRTFVQMFYATRMICKNPKCPNDTNSIPERFVDKFPVCGFCQDDVIYQKISSRDLYLQLSYYLHIFDVSKYKKEALMDEAVELAYAALTETVEEVVRHCDYLFVGLPKQFSFSTEENDDCRLTC